MQLREVEALVQRYLAGQATDEDLRLLDEWFTLSGQKAYDLSEEKRQEITARLFPVLQAHAHRRTSGWWKRRLPAAAAAAILAVAGAGWLIQEHHQTTITAGLYETITGRFLANTRVVL